MWKKHLLTCSALTAIATSWFMVTRPNFAFSGARSPASQAGRILDQSRLHDEYTVFRLDEGAEGRVIGIAQGSSTDRYQVHVMMDLDDGQEHDLWIHYRPDLPGYRQAIQLFDANGQPTQDVTQAASLVTTRPGVSAWSDMEHNAEATQSLSLLWKKPSGKRFVASSKPRPTPPKPTQTSVQPIVGGRLWNTDCEDFIEPNGHYGSYGADLLSVVGNARTPEIFGGEIGDIAKVCPKYSQFSSAERQNFWIWFAASVAMVESNCNPEVTAHGTTKGHTAAGLWQLDLGHTSRYCDGVCGSINALNGNENVQCGIRMLSWYTGADQQNESRLVYWEGNYWESLHANGTLWKTERYVHEFHACFE